MKRAVLYATEDDGTYPLEFTAHGLRFAQVYVLRLEPAAVGARYLILDGEKVIAHTGKYELDRAIGGDQLPWLVVERVD